MFGVLKRGKREGVKRGKGEKRGWEEMWGKVVVCHQLACLLLFHHHHTHTPLLVLCLPLSFLLSLSFSCLSLSVLSGCGVWFVPRVCHTPPTHSLCLVLAAPPFLPLASTSLSLLSSSSSSCCCGFVWVLLFVTPPLCFLACLWCVVVLVPRPPSFCPTSPCPFCPCPPLSSSCCCWWWC